MVTLVCHWYTKSGLELNPVRAWHSPTVARVVPGSALILRPLSQPPGHCPHHPSLLMYTVRKMMLQDNQPGLNSSLNLELCNMMVRDTLSHTPLLTGPCRASVHHSRRSLEL